MTENIDKEDVNVTVAGDDEVYGEVLEMLGANRVKVRCFDGETRTCRIPGRMQKRVWIREDDIVIVEPWDWQDEKADIVYRYEQKDLEILREEGIISPEL